MIPAYVYMSVTEEGHWSRTCGFESHLRQLIFLRKSDGLVALPCCLFDLACFFLPSFSSLIKIFTTCTRVHVVQLAWEIYRGGEREKTGGRGKKIKGGRGRGGKGIIMYLLRKRERTFL